MENIVIIGNGISGVTAARHIRKLSDKRITIISAESEYFFSRTALMYVYMGHMKFEHTQPYENWFWKKNRIDLIHDYVTKVDHKNKHLQLKDKGTIAYDKLIIATGSKPNRFGWPGQDLKGVQGLYSKQELEQLELDAPNKDSCHRAVIVGGGLIGIELAEMLRSREIPVTFLVRESSFWNGVLPEGESQMINEHIREHHIDLRLSTNLVEILADENGKAKAVVTDTGETIECNLVGLTAGVTPNIGFLKDSGIELGRGVKVNRFLETNIPDIYSIGDCAEQHQPIGNRRTVEAVWYTGRMMGETVAQTICGKKTAYQPGHWFNSAKFLDIEYQTYGWVFSDKGRKEYESHFHWRHPKEKLCITVAYHKESKKFLGINTFGIRMRHEIFDRWLTEERSVDHVMEYLKDANFDPEFYTQYEAEIVTSYNQQLEPTYNQKEKLETNFYKSVNLQKVMKTIKNIGLVIFLVGLGIFTALPLLGTFSFSQLDFEQLILDNNIKSELFVSSIEQDVVSKQFAGMQALSPLVADALEKANSMHRKNKEYKKVIYTKPQDMAAMIGKKAGAGFIVENKGIMWFLTFGLGILGALLYILPNVVLLGQKGIKNNGIYLENATNRGWIAWMVFVFLVSFYLILYFRPQYAVNWTYLVDPVSMRLSGNMAGHWFVYGFMYCVVMTVMAVRMYIKYRHNMYQMVRTTSVLFFQIIFAFLIPEIMVRLQMPYYDFKNAFPLDYDFFFQWNLRSLINSGGIGLFILVWGTVLTLVIVPVMVYFFGKRWYCSWVCGCGGLAETLGDPYRQHSSKTLLSWKVERWLVHGVLVFAVGMTLITLYSFFSETGTVLGIKTASVQNTYSLLIGSIFAGVIGTGFYPIFGNRVWCRFGCPLAAYLGFVQRFKSRFRITTNGGQCISCGNCSTYCEQGIDVRAYAQKGENIIRSSCVGCGICSAVCPRGVLKLENGPEKGRINPTEVLLGNDVDLMHLVNDK